MKNVAQLQEDLLESVRKVTKETWLGTYAKTREWEDKMFVRDDDFVEDTTGAEVQPEGPAEQDLDESDEEESEGEEEEEEEGGDGADSGEN
jgi:hypothetical protein